MKTVGLIGGMSWESTAYYYSLLNEGVKSQLGGLHSARIAMISVDFAPIEEMQHRGEWHTLGDQLAAEAVRLEQAGSDFILIATNTMHKVYEKVQRAVGIEVLHIADPTGNYLTQHNISKVGLLGTAFTMEEAFYKQRLIDRFGVDVIVPDSDDRSHVHSIIFKELCMGTINSISQEYFLSVINKLKERGAEAVILGCTEIGLLVKQNDCELPLVDTVEQHVEAAVMLATE